VYLPDFRMGCRYHIDTTRLHLSLLRVPHPQ